LNKPAEAKSADEQAQMIFITRMPSIDSQNISTEEKTLNFTIIKRFIWPIIIINISIIKFTLNYGEGKLYTVYIEVQNSYVEMGNFLGFDKPITACNLQIPKDAQANSTYLIEFPGH